MRQRPLRVEVATLAELARLAVISVGGAPVSVLEVKVARWRPPTRGWLGMPGIAGLTVLEVRTDDRTAAVRMSTADPVDPSILIAAALRCLRPHPAGELEPMLTFTPGLSESAAPMADRLTDVLLEGEEPDRHVRRCDVLIAPSADTTVERARTVVIGDEWTVDGTEVAAWVDPSVHRPLGRRSRAEGDVGTVVVDRDATVITWPGGQLRVGADLTPADVRAVLTLRGVVTADEASQRVLAQLAACGIVVATDADSLPAPDDHLAWEVASVAARRAALRDHSAPAAVTGWPSVSVILATHRADHIEAALRQVAAFEYPDLEVVIGAHGPALDAATVSALASTVPHPTRVIPVDSERTLGEVLQICSDRSDGTLVTKMDDDDVYGADHVWDLVVARHYSGAQVVGKALDWIRVESEDVTVFRPTYAAEKYASFVAGGTMLISRADLAAVGGWRPVPKSVDRALLDRVLADGGLVYRTHGLGYVYVRGGHGHTASVQDAHFLTKTAATYPGLIQHEVFGTA